MTSRTLIFHDGALGDLLLSLPALEALGAHSPHIHLAGRPDAAGLLHRAGYVDEFSDAGGASYAGFFSSRPGPEVRESLRRFSRAYIFSRRPASPLAGAIRSVIRDTQVVLTIPPRGSQLHASAFRLGQLKRTGSHSSIPREAHLSSPSFGISPASESRLREIARGRAVVAVHPGSGSRRKNWPLDRFLEVVRELADSGAAALLLLSGPGEPSETAEALRNFAAQHEGSALHLDGESLTAVASVLGMADLYLGNDSGVTHLASLISPRVVAVYGPTDPSVWGPVGGARVIENRSVCAQCIEPERRCAPRTCLLSILPQVVLGEIYRLLGGTGK